MASRQSSEIIVAADAQALAETAADRLLGRIRQAKAQPAICLTGGSDPQRLYHLLATEPYRSQLPWQDIHWFIGDDRFVPIDHPLSNMGMARRAFLDLVAAPESNIHPITTEMADPDAAARHYEAELKRFYGMDRLDPKRQLFDVVLMGLGIDGHTASLFPGSAALNESERWVVGVEKAGLEPFVPRVSLTFPTLASTREMLFLVGGDNKKEILTRVLSGDDLPAGRARSNGDLIWLVDRDAAAEDRHAGTISQG